ncbi:unnamed protein product [Acanthocheilonema viteae]|uniref:Exosome complex component N-terminal domain-containing protein n=1 Tax=Acanthocheilonema viteae TaxID=6277 RepID=A0A498SIW7_ACAVI|nr:unnamed protein product [Acanthocheilonema viteae]
MNASSNSGSSNACFIGEGCSKYVIPGDRLFPISEQMKAGIGTYELFGHIYASLAGTVHMYTTVERDKETKIVEVRRQSEKEKRHVMPYVGCIVTAKIKLEQCVHPGDVILARVIGFGDNQHSYLLSTVEDELGVVSGIGDFGERMVPCSFSEVKSVITSAREPRKVARIPDLNR